MDADLQGVLTQAELADAVERDAAPAWVAEHWRTFRDALTGERDGTTFPCHFGAQSVAAGDPLYTTVPSARDADALLAFRDALRDYLERYESHNERASLVAFFAPDPALETEADYHERLWHVLQFLHVHDTEPWPEHIPTDADDEHWEFCFGGEAIFPTCRAPFYDTYHSRYSPVGLEITFQPRALFDGITADTAAGQHAREMIQERLEAYDDVAPHPHLGDWGVEGDREWPQYMLREDDAQAPAECPLDASREHPKVSPRFDPAFGDA